MQSGLVGKAQIVAEPDDDGLAGLPCLSRSPQYLGPYEFKKFFNGAAAA